jgi:hypothetical protein
VNARGCSFDFLRHHVIAHLFIPTAMYARFNYCLGFLSWDYMCSLLSSPLHIVANVNKLDSTTLTGNYNVDLLQISKKLYEG